MDSESDSPPPAPPPFTEIAGGRFADLLSRWSEEEFLAHDFFRAGAAPPEGVAPEDLPVLRVYHRLLRAYPDPAVADALYALGFHSAHQVAAVPEHRFVREHAEALGGPEKARDVHRGARGARARARLVGAAVRDLAGSAHFKATRFYNGSTETVSYYTDVPSYQDFFGGTYYYTCPECASVLGPAAYFLDLMRIADFYVGEPNAGTVPAGWGLEERRPDLFDSLLLDCENSTATQPILVIVNEILEAHLEKALQVDDLWRDVFPIARYPFNQPFAQPLAQLRAMLPQLRT
ncbi:MAG TPA: Tc toxin subunit A, partial [Longimicrobiaceae bacterium]|nr:Tc toxin subunit A [Longimicrobiaceae bacterium]